MTPYLESAQENAYTALKISGEAASAVFEVMYHGSTDNLTTIAPLATFRGGSPILSHHATSNNIIFINQYNHLKMRL